MWKMELLHKSKLCVNHCEIAEASNFLGPMRNERFSFSPSHCLCVCKPFCKFVRLTENCAICSYCYQRMYHAFYMYTNPYNIIKTKYYIAKCFVTVTLFSWGTIMIMGHFHQRYAKALTYSFQI